MDTFRQVNIATVDFDTEFINARILKVQTIINYICRPCSSIYQRWQLPSVWNPENH